MVPDVEEVGGEADLLAVSDVEVFDERDVLVLLEGATVKIPTKVAEARGAEIGVGLALSWVQLRCRRERQRIQIAVDALVNVATGKAAPNASAGRQTGS